MATTPLLYGSPRSPYVRKVRILLHEKKVDYRFDTEYGPQIQPFNPLAKVPTFILPDGTAIFDSPVVAEFLDIAYPDPLMIPGSAMERLEIKRWEALTDGICDAAVLITSERLRKEEAERSATWIERQSGKVERSLAYASSQLGDRQWACQGRLTLADAGLAAALGYVSLRHPTIEWRGKHANLARYYDTLQKTKSVELTEPVPDGR